MGSNNPGGKGQGGFARGKTRRARKHEVLIKKANRARNAAAKGQ